MARVEVEISVVSPARNESANLEALVDEVEKALAPTGRSFEFIVVDDGSTDATPTVLCELCASRPWLRVLRMRETPTGRGRGHGQSAAFHAGFRAARGALIAVLDADLQNLPADIPAMIALMDETGADLVQGDRSASRQDPFIRFVGMWVGRIFRRWVLGDSIRDTGCSLRVMKREVGLRIPLEFRGMHRYIPGTARKLGFLVEEMGVQHRARSAGTSKYGILNRGIPGLLDVFAVRWMNKRRRPTAADDITPMPEREVMETEIGVHTENPMPCEHQFS